MSELNFTVPFPKNDKQYINKVRDLAWASLSDIPPRERKLWPFLKKGRCQIRFFHAGDVELGRVAECVSPVTRALHNLLWHPKASVLMEYSEVANSEPKVVVRVVADE